MIRLQTNVGREDRWRDRLLDIVSELVAVTDPQINRKHDYKRAVALIQQAQLLLDFNEGKAADLNGALNAFGLTLNQFVGEVADDDLDRLEQHRVLLAVHAGVIDATKAVLGTGEFPNPETIGP